MNTLYLYSTAGCHLCEQAEALVNPLLQDYGLTLEIVDIAESDTLMERYGIRIPVLRMAGRQDDLGWPFDMQAVHGYLQGGRARQADPNDTPARD